MLSLLVRFLGLMVAVLLFSACTAAAGSGATSAPLLDSMVASAGHTCGLDVTGGVWCWGQNQMGQLGSAATQDSSSPVNVGDLGAGNRAISTGPVHTCALVASGQVRCWGGNAAGQLGSGTHVDSRAGVEAGSLPGISRALAAGAEYTCVLNAVGGVLCWGSNAHGQLGVAAVDASDTPLDVTGLGSGLTALSSGWYHTCALTVAGGVKCWGDNQYGQLGNGTTTDSPLPVDVEGLNFGVRQISAGAGHTCALTAVGAVKCWGQNQSGQLGNGSNQDSSTPQEVSGLSAGVREVSAGGDASTGAAHTCAITVSGGVVCWGSNLSGQLGDGTNTDSNIPVSVQGLTYGMRAVTAGGAHTCALGATGSALCWGDNQYGQLGDGSQHSSPQPVTVK